MSKTASTKNSLRDLGRILNDELLKIRVDANEKAKDVAIEVLKIAVRHTKIDTSKAKSNWQVSLNNPIENDRKAWFEGEHGSTIEQSTTATIGTGFDVISNKKPGQPIYIVNNIDYVEEADVDKARDSAVEEGLLLAEIGKNLASPR